MRILSVFTFILLNFLVIVERSNSFFLFKHGISYKQISTNNNKSSTVLFAAAKKIKSLKSSKSLKNNGFDSVLKDISLSENQQKYYDSLLLRDISLVFCVGPAGCGKTLLACNAAILGLKSKIYDKIIITRPLVSVDEELGFLPGTFEAKMDPWTRPIFDIFRETFTSLEIKHMMEAGLIEISPLAYMRGRTFKNAFIIADEMQNSSPNQMKMILTRIGEGSKMVITGDLMQSDRIGENGLLDFIMRYNSAEVSSLISCIELEKSDVRRSCVVSKILDIYDIEPCDLLVERNTTEVYNIMDPIECRVDYSFFNNTNDSDINNNIDSREVSDNDSALIPKHLFKKLDFDDWL
jgi:phosphate starvation-inducible PhoH-like protein